MTEVIKEEVTQTHESGEEVKTDEVKVVEEKTVNMTQAELDALIAKSKNQVRKQFADYDEVKAKADEADRIAEEARLAKLDEVERAKEEAKAKEDEVTSLQAELNSMKQAQKTKEINDKFAEVALSVNIPKEFIEDAKVLAKVTDATSVEDIEEIVTKLVKERPFLVKEEVVQREIGGASNPPKQKNEKSDAQLLQEAADKYRRTQRMEDKIAYVNLKHALANK
ncbi:hypothetical protein BK703_16915 [Bacillus thuringiensis serovar silo]|uniref:hypothetical protein n=1 Tax=Bacillus thuringiensis TaxID=1428 RepID=UPI000A38901F|nr:hypothetical protein [Bacillus thuringiensis]MED3275389.1 hypothetical protein [Bacillus thuringiensis]OTW55320.1 hypothetical protein BK703_16915 [Bacillus thuringiensis serovar silo]OTW74248.1 hypothetical protein BK700_01130 [Bacillus thuringiensis serovar toguchini]